MLSLFDALRGNKRSTRARTEADGQVRTFAGAVRIARQRVGWTQEDLAEAAGLTQPMVTKLERGRRRPTLGTALAISSAFREHHGLTLLDLSDRDTLLDAELPDLEAIEGTETPNGT